MPFSLEAIGYPKVSDHTRYLDLCPALMGSSLKEVQRGWVYETVLRLLPPGARVIDMGGSACELADALSDQFQMMVVDPYDGSGNGPSSPERFRKRYPKLEIVQGVIGADWAATGFDAVISTSVVEHIPDDLHEGIVTGIHNALRPGGYSIHAIDLTVRGVNGFLEERHRQTLESFAAAHGLSISANDLRRQMLEDVDTYYLSPAMYQQWRRDRTFAQYPWRQVGSANFVARKA